MSEEKSVQNKVTITAREAAAFIGISYWSILELCKSGKIPYISVGKKRLFRQESLLRWIAESECIAQKSPIQEQSQ